MFEEAKPLKKYKYFEKTNKKYTNKKPSLMLYVSVICYRVDFSSKRRKRWHAAPAVGVGKYRVFCTEPNTFLDGGDYFLR